MQMMIRSILNSVRLRSLLNKLKHTNDSNNEIFLEIKLRIDRDVELEQVSLKEFLQNSRTFEYEHVPEVYFDVIQHPLSILPKSEEEAALYKSHSVRAPEMMLERLQNYFWFPSIGFVISKLGVVWRHSVLGQFADPNFLETYAVEDRKIDNKKIEYIFWPHLLSNAKRISGTKIILSHYASHNYGHFLLDMVPLISFAASNGLEIVTRPLTNWQKSFFSLYDIGKDKITECADRCYKLDDFIVSNRHNAVSTYCASPKHRVMYEDLLKRIKSKYPELERKEYPKRLFLSRSGSKTRVLKNRAETANMLASYGFTTVKPEEFSIPEQAIMFNNADIIVTEFGAVAANVAFCKKNTTVLEIIPCGQKDPWSVHLCSALGLKYIALFQEVKQQDRKKISIGGVEIDNLHTSYKCNIDQLEYSIKRLVCQSLQRLFHGISY